MRFELGDTIITQGAITSPLCDEEYDQIIAGADSWRKAKLRALEAIMMKLSYEVDTSVAGLSYSLSSRADRWRQMYKDLRKELQVALPSAPALFGPCSKTIDGGHYFYADMQTNPRKG